MRTRLFSVLWFLSAAFVLWGVAMSSGCAQMSALMRAEAIEKEAQTARFRFLEKVRDAYFLIGDEYYRLAIEAEDRGDEKLAKEYSAKAGLYLMFSKGVKRDLDDLRARVGAASPGAPHEETVHDGG